MSVYRINWKEVERIKALERFFQAGKKYSEEVYNRGIWEFYSLNNLERFWLGNRELYDFLASKLIVRYYHIDNEKIEFGSLEHEFLSAFEEVERTYQ